MRSRALIIQNSVFDDDENVLYASFNTMATSHMWLFSTWNGPGMTEELNFLILYNSN